MSAIARLTDRAVIRLTGPDRKSFLQGVITQDLGRLKNDKGIFSALLTPQGKILYDFFVVEAGDALLFDCRADAAADIIKRLSLYKLRAKVTIEADETQRVFTCASDPNEESMVAFKDPRLDAMGWRAIGAGAADDDADYDRRRITLGVSEFGKDFEANEIFPTDVNYDALGVISYKKGCFVGQEVASRMKRKGAIRKRTLIAQFDDVAPQKGVQITAGDAVLGEITSVSGDLALARIRVDRLEDAQSANLHIQCGPASMRLRIPDYLETP